MSVFASFQITTPTPYPPHPQFILLLVCHDPHCSRRFFATNVCNITVKEYQVVDVMAMMARVRHASNDLPRIDLALAHNSDLHDVQKVRFFRFGALNIPADLILESRFQPSVDISGQTPVKSSVQRSIRSNVLSQWKITPETLEQLWPKKESIVHVKWSVPSTLLGCMYMYV